MVDLFRELRHRHARDDPRRDRRDRLVAETARALHHGQLLGGLAPAQLADECRAGDEPVAEDPLQVEHRLGPHAVAHRGPAGGPEPAHRALEGGEAVVALVDDQQLAGQVAAELEDRCHAREQEHRLATGTEERARDPVVRLRALAEGRDLALEPGQVLEVGRGRQEEEVDPALLHPLVEAPPALAVVEHGTRV
jgi:hypothetical protein